MRSIILTDAMKTVISFNEDCTYHFVSGLSPLESPHLKRLWRINEVNGLKRLEFKETQYSKAEWCDFFHRAQRPEIDEFIAKLETWFVEVTLFNIDSETIEAQGDN